MDAALISAQLLKARDSVVEVGRFKFTVRRPSEAELMRRRHRANGSDLLTNLASVQEDVVGWDGVLESDILDGGASEAVPFNRVVYAMWIEDRADLWEALAKHIEKVVDEHQRKIEALRGN
jgi:hypothetical protein